MGTERMGRGKRPRCHEIINLNESQLLVLCLNFQILVFEWQILSNLEEEEWTALYWADSGFQKQLVSELLEEECTGLRRLCKSSSECHYEYWPQSLQHLELGRQNILDIDIDW